MKKGSSLIEIIFAIVIISISMMSVPMILKQNTKSGESAIMQEAILATSTKMGNILSYSWDKNSYDAKNGILRTVDVKNGDSHLARSNESNNSNLRMGNIFFTIGRKFFDCNNFMGMINFNKNKSNCNGITYPDTTVNHKNKVSINDFHNETVTISGGGSYDYKDSNLSIKSAIYYIPDSANYDDTNIHFTFTTPTNTPITSDKSTNIKMIVTTANSPMLKRKLTLRAYEANIGQAILSTRTK